MSESIQLTVPEDISLRAKQIAAEGERPVEELLIEYLKSFSAPMPVLEPEQQAELDALVHLSDDALWTIAREQLPDSVQSRAHTLMSQNNHGSINDAEKAEFENLVVRADQLILRKAESASILKQRGYEFKQDDFTAKHE